MVLNICNFIQRTEQVPVELDISAIEEYILLLLLVLEVFQKTLMLLNIFLLGYITVFQFYLSLKHGFVSIMYQRII